MPGTIEPKKKRKGGFASLSPERRREIATQGGVAAHKKGTAHEFTSDEARAAGQKGGLAPHVQRGPLPKAHAPEHECDSGVGDVGRTAEAYILQQ